MKKWFGAILILLLVLVPNVSAATWQELRDSVGMSKPFVCEYDVVSTSSYYTLTDMDKIYVKGDGGGMYVSFENNENITIDTDDETKTTISGQDVRFGGSFANNFLQNYVYLSGNTCPEKMVVTEAGFTGGYYLVDTYIDDYDNGLMVTVYDLKPQTSALNECVSQVEGAICNRYQITIEEFKSDPYLTKTLYLELGYEPSGNEWLKYFSISDDSGFNNYRIGKEMEYSDEMSFTLDDVVYHIRDEDADELFLPGNKFVESSKVVFNSSYVAIQHYYIAGHEIDLSHTDRVEGEVTDQVDDPFYEPEDIGIGEVEEMVFCDQDNVRNTFQIIGYLLFAAKVAVPLLLIILGVMDFSKAVISDDDKSVKEAGFMFAKRVIIAAIIFLIPTILNFLFSLVDGAADLGGKFEGCTNCLFEPLDASGCEYETLKEQAEN